MKSFNKATLSGHSLDFVISTSSSFNIEDNVEEFLEEIERFYELTETFLSLEAAKLYEKVNQSIENYSEKCRKAF